MSSTLSAKLPGAYCKSVTGFVIDITHCIQPDVCACFSGLPWGGTGVFQQGRIFSFIWIPFQLWPLEPVDKTEEEPHSISNKNRPVNMRICIGDGGSMDLV